MALLGTLGIDWKLFLIQCLNFIILFLLLKWFFYKPIIKILRREKKELEEVRREKENIEKEKRRFLKEREELLRSAKEKARSIIEESERMALEFREKLKREKELSEKKMMEEIEKKEDYLKKSLIEKWREEFYRKKEEEILLLMREKFPEEVLKEIQEYFFERLLENIRLTKIDFSLEKIIKEKYKKKKTILNVVFEYAFPLEKDKLDLIRRIVVDKTKGLEISFQEKRNKDLLSGFRLRVGGFLIESNLASDIKSIVYEE